MKGEWVYFKKYFSDEICDYILEKGLQIEAVDATLGADGTSVVPDHRKSKVRFIQKNDKDFEFLFNALWNVARTANNEWFDFNISDITYLQLAEYDESYGGEYKKHHDVFWMNNDPKLHRKLTCVIQLTDPSEYDGGDFTLYDVDEYPSVDEIRERGTVIVIPSFVNHAALPITRGTRYSLAAWFDGPKWK